MIADSVHPPEPTPGAVRLCDGCGRVLPALDKSEYTPARAHVVATVGLCLCPTGGPEGPAKLPDRAPSLM